MHSGSHTWFNERHTKTLSLLLWACLLRNGDLDLRKGSIVGGFTEYCKTAERDWAFYHQVKELKVEGKFFRSFLQDWGAIVIKFFKIVPVFSKLADLKHVCFENPLGNCFIIRNLPHLMESAKHALDVAVCMDIAHDRWRMTDIRKRRSFFLRRRALLENDGGPKKRRIYREPA